MVKTIEEKQEYHRQWYIENKERVLARQRERYRQCKEAGLPHRDMERYQTYNKQWREENQDYIKVTGAENRRKPGAAEHAYFLKLLREHGLTKEQYLLCVSCKIPSAGSVSEKRLG